jgi:hypothetical protein
MPAVTMKAKNTPNINPRPGSGGRSKTRALSYSIQMNSATTAICSVIHASVRITARHVD